MNPSRWPERLEMAVVVFTAFVAVVWLLLALRDPSLKAFGMVAWPLWVLSYALESWRAERIWRRFCECGHVRRIAKVTTEDHQ